MRGRKEWEERVWLKNLETDFEITIWRSGRRLKMCWIVSAGRL